MPVTYVPIATTTLSNSAASVTFSNVSQLYTDLIVTITGTATAGASPFLRFNGDSSTSYSITEIYAYVSGGTGFIESSRGKDKDSASIGSIGTAGNTGRSINIAEIFNYSNSSVFKTTYGRGYDTGTGYNIIRATLWNNAAAITSILVGVGSGATYDSGTVFSLYGIKAA